MLEGNGWVLQRIKGSHHIYSKPGERKIISIPVHGNRNLKTGLANRIARDANVLQIRCPEDVNFDLAERLLRTKHESWSYEQEVRMFVGLNDPPDAVRSQNE